MHDISVLDKPFRFRFARRARQITRVSLIAMLILCGVLLTGLSLLLSPLCKPEKFARLFMQTWMRLAISAIGVRISTAGIRPQPGTLLVCNHISWLDIIVLAATMPVRFVSK